MARQWQTPDGGFVDETGEEEYQLPDGGMFFEDQAVVVGAIPLLVGGCMGQTMGSNCNLMTG